MKQFLLKTFVAGVAFACAGQVQAQENQKDNDKKKETQHIIINRKGNVDERTVIEINGDKITINGKEVKDSNNDDVTVRVHKIKDPGAIAGRGRGGNFNFNFEDGDQTISLFSEDANRAMLGVVTERDEKGARVTSVSKESAAEKAGLKQGDIITRIDDEKIDDTEDVSKAIRKRKPGDKASVTVIRDGKEQKITTELGKWKGIRMNAENFHFNFPDNWDVPAPRVAPFPSGGPRLGLSVQDTEDGRGVKVLEVDESGHAAKSGVKPNDVITHVDDNAVNSASEISKFLRSNRDKSSYTLKVLRNGKTQNIEVKVPRKLKTADL
jgi:serine protease Do